MNWNAVLASMAPENALLAGIVLLISADIVATRPRRGFALALIATGAAAFAAAVLAASGYAAAPFAGQFSIGPASAAAKLIVLGLALPVVLIARDENPGSRFYMLLLSSLYGVCLMLSADSFLTLFLGLELMSIPVYTLVVVGLRRPQSAEAALKYLVLSGTASAMFLMGVSMIYGGSGSMALAAFAKALLSGSPAATAGVVLILAAFFLKAAVVPFHAWAPDAYEAASVPVTAYMATIVKAGVLLAVVRLFALAPVDRPIVDLIAILPLVSIVWGNLAAMRQTSFRRMIAYSSIAHAGYLFFAFLGDGPTRFQAVAFYIVAYGLMNLLAFASLPRSDDDGARDDLERLKGLFHRDPWAALMIGIAMLSLAGIPPFPGFVAKFLIFKNVIAAGWTTYAVLGLVGSYLGIYFYLRVIQYLFMSPAAADTGRGQQRAAIAAGLLCLLPSMLLVVFPGWLITRL
jgi:NADH-quinone oxidoreductase subunit N